MKFRRRALRLLLLAPALTSSIALAASADTSTEVRLAARDDADEYSVLPDSHMDAPSSRAEVGTKDAPVDGWDGKPHKGPWVDSSSDDAKETSTSTKSGKTSKSHKSSEAYGVMDDPNRASPKKGTTGTEGGISEKDTDFSKERSPESPKEAPATDLDAVTGEEVSKKAAKKAKSGVGLEVSNSILPRLLLSVHG
jgi:Ca2+/H+ antiporter, TMEM165/GDT1 family